MDALQAIREQLYIANCLRVAQLTENPVTRDRRVSLALEALEHTAPDDDWAPDESELC